MTCLKHIICYLISGEKSFKFEEFIAFYQSLIACEQGTFADYMEAFKTFDREGQGFISGGELRHLLSSLGRCLCYVS